MGNAAADRIALSTDSVAVAAKRVGSHAEDIRASHAATQAMLDDGLYGCVVSSVIRPTNGTRIAASDRSTRPQVLSVLQLCERRPARQGRCSAPARGAARHGPAGTRRTDRTCVAS